MSPPSMIPDAVNRAVHLGRPYRLPDPTGVNRAARRGRPRRLPVTTVLSVPTVCAVPTVCSAPLKGWCGAQPSGAIRPGTTA